MSTSELGEREGKRLKSCSSACAVQETSAWLRNCRSAIPRRSDAVSRAKASFRSRESLNEPSAGDLTSVRRPCRSLVTPQLIMIHPRCRILMSRCWGGGFCVDLGCLRVGRWIEYT